MTAARTPAESFPRALPPFRRRSRVLSALATASSLVATFAAMRPPGSGVSRKPRRALPRFIVAAATSRSISSRQNPHSCRRSWIAFLRRSPQPGQSWLVCSWPGVAWIASEAPHSRATRSTRSPMRVRCRLSRMARIADGRMTAVAGAAAAGLANSGMSGAP